MYKVMLVDDDFPVLAYLKKVIPWENLDMQLIGSYDNGQKAYDKAMVEMPDILITDIGMPVMNGLELINGLTAHKDNLRSVILSCHDEFTFAMEAIKLNVVEYILKESLDPKVLTSLLSKIKQGLDEDKKIKQQLIKKELISSLTENPILNEATWIEQASHIGLDFHQNNYIPVLCCINRHYVAQKRYSTQNLLSFSVQNVIDEIIERQIENGTLHLSYNGKETVLLFPYQDFLKKNVYDTLHELLHKVSESLKNYLKFSVTLIIGTRSRDSLELKAYIKQLLDSKERSFYIQEGSIINLESLDFSYSNEDLFAKYVEATQQFQDLILKENEMYLKVALVQWIATIQKEKYKPQVVREWGLKILLDLRVKIKSLQYFETKFSEEVVHQNLLHTETLEHFQDTMWNNLVELLRVISSFNSGSKRREIIEAQRYIIDHLHEKISLSDLADQLHLNSTYFSRLFKKETNENFVDFVIRLKMEKACEYLEHSHHSIEQISDMLGFESKSYFIRTFRKFKGMLPVEYKHRS
ncbi:helix-turn-helix domain-containing protein [Paenibacillus sp. LMG 31456]|uniref:Helix-turn-helix domain-containing protein n=1 Tax=Paenibacillus foliorum TaxID=2654974 RepID=A0A972GWN6_9BACL|nr:helix-turn-helix domain-containing protein [Paenibacillus foliorum]NOU95879.1 helix-turn-helix domain-containing protein [Paenibacillus foliorum]